jgi:adenine-specific DNA-methyltransferase
MVTESLVLPPASCVIYTPQPLADAIVEAFSDDKAGTWLEPSCGSGVFVESLLRHGIAGSDITAVDVDANAGPRDNRANVLRGVEFLDWASHCSERYDHIIGNPPYLRISELPEPLRYRAANIEQPGGGLVGQTANCWYSFFCAAFHLLDARGSLAFVLPAAWDYAGYAGRVRENIGEWFRSVRIYRCRRSLFDKVADGAVVLIARGKGTAGQVVRSEHRTIDEVIGALRVEGAKVVGSPAPTRARSRKSVTTNLGAVVKVHIGAVTGDAGFFLLRESQRSQHRIPAEACLPALTKSRHLIAAVIGQAEWQELRSSDERVWLFRPNRAWTEHPRVRAYLALRETEGGCNREAYKIRDRKPWYRTHVSRAADAFVSGNTRVGPWLALRRMPRLTATNTLYLARFRQRLSREAQAAWGLALLTSRARESWTSLVRVYPEGLVKAEPGDLCEVQIPFPTRYEGAEKAYMRAVGLLLSGEGERARELADSWVGASNG